MSILELIELSSLDHDDQMELWDNIEKMRVRPHWYDFVDFEDNLPWRGCDTDERLALILEGICDWCEAPSGYGFFARIHEQLIEPYI